ncbi:MAG: flagellar assembly protein FliW [Proteobacteria bacterium]|nr:flagellar assembly protein FliW [Pseudomonadota bacterium]
MKFDTTRFGQIDVKSEDIVIFPDGPLGFPDCTRFTFIDEERAAPFRMLQSLDNPALAFVVVDPLIARSNFHFDVTLDDLKLVKAESTDNLLVFAIVTMSRNIHEVTLNLQGPLVINPKQKLGHQFVLVETDYTTREKLLQNVDDQATELKDQGIVIGTEQEQKQAV